MELARGGFGCGELSWGLDDLACGGLGVEV